MNPIRAFVGHSFSEDDAVVVGKFTKYLDQLAELHQNFSWEHAESAEPRVIDEKVLRLFSGKNLFIGICTKNERVIAHSSLTNSFFLPRKLNAKEEDFGWKTSDWIIQEIGLAVGRDLHLILLVEQGVRSPGGLQGNMERIEFERDAPEKIFGKLVEMISALSPKVSVATMGEVESKAALPDDKDTKQVAAGDDWKTPKPEWKRADYEFALMLFVSSDDTAGAKSISDQYFQTESGKQPQSRKSWEAYTEYLNLAHGKGGSLAQLTKLAADDEGDSEISTYLARIYEKYEDFGKAAVTYTKAAGLAGDISDELQLLGKAACAHQLDGNKADAVALIARIKSMSADAGEGEAEVLQAERKLAEIAHEDEILIATMERLLDLDPTDMDTRFALAYKYANQGSNELAALHYARIPSAERSAFAWNNLGVAFDQIGLPAKSVDAYRKSEKMGETLAMSNLANKLIEAGFLSEAQTICDEALKLKDIHKNVGSTLGRLRGLPEDEDKKEAEAQKKAKPLSEFYKEFGRGVARPMPTNLANRWQGPDCILDIVFA
ncbi:MAG: hypothetical protein HY273_00160, partial [Gammaproteobacteria bacterium]|nr:hypothetical protein [Gammaproteobacteria bacterium]